MRLTRTCSVILAVGVCSILIEGCGKTEESFYSDCKAKDTVQAYEEYIEAYPEGAHSSSARERIEQLRVLAYLRSGIRDGNPVKKAEAILAVQRTDTPPRLKELVPDLISCLSDRSEVTIDDASNGAKVQAGHAVPSVPRQSGLGGWVLPSGGSATGMGVSGGRSLAFRFSHVGREAAVALSRITGQSFGEEQSQWESWWKQQTGR